MWTRITFNKWVNHTETAIHLLDVFAEDNFFGVAKKNVVRVEDISIKDEDDFDEVNSLHTVSHYEEFATLEELNTYLESIGVPAYVLPEKSEQGVWGRYEGEGSHDFFGRKTSDTKFEVVEIISFVSAKEELQYHVSYTELNREGEIGLFESHQHFVDMRGAEPQNDLHMVGYKKTEMGISSADKTTLLPMAKDEVVEFLKETYGITTDIFKEQV